MIKIAIYGKGGIGKSTTTSNLSAALSAFGYKVMQIGCDPKSDSTKCLMGGVKIPTVLGQIREKGPQGVTLEDLVYTGFHGILCVEAGGLLQVLAVQAEGLSRPLKSWRSWGPLSAFNPISYSMMYWEMWYAAALPCPFAAASRNGC